MFLSPVRVYCAITNPLHFHSGPVQALYRLVYVAITFPVQTLYDFLTVQYRHCMGHLMAASTMPLRYQNVFFLMGLYWPSDGSLPSRYRLPVMGRLIPSVQIVTGPVQNNGMRPL